MIGAIAYCVFSGSDVATERSLFMILVMLGAILVDRPALSLRNPALSALIVLAREPETLADVLRGGRRPDPIAEWGVAARTTAPCSAFHFQNLNACGLIGNAVTLPLVSAAVIGVLAYPCGLDGRIW